MLYTYRATDPEGGTTTWSVAGTDGGDFAIYDGMLSFRRLPDFESPADADRDNEYLLTVQASDGRNTGSLEVTVVVTEQDEGPEV